MNSNFDKLLNKYTRVSGVRLSMVIDAKMQLFGPTSTSDDVSNTADRALLMHLRSLADLVITDAATAAAEKYRPSKFCDIEIWSRTASFRGLAEIAAQAQSYAISLQQVSDIASRLAILRASRDSILLETGPNLTAQLAQSQLIDFASISVTGAETDQNAAFALNEFVERMGLGYLEFVGQVWSNETLFARFQR